MSPKAPRPLPFFMMSSGGWSSKGRSTPKSRYSGNRVKCKIMQTQCRRSSRSLSFSFWAFPGKTELNFANRSGHWSTKCARGSSLWLGSPGCGRERLGRRGPRRTGSDVSPPASRGHSQSCRERGTLARRATLVRGPAWLEANRLVGIPVGRVQGRVFKA